MEKAFGNEKASVGASISAAEKAQWMAHWTIKKFLGDFPGMSAQEIEAAGVEPFEVLEVDGNCLLNDGINSIIWPAVVGALATPLNGTDGCMGVGDSSTAAAASQTGLQAGTNHLWVSAFGDSDRGFKSAACGKRNLQRQPGELGLERGLRRRHKHPSVSASKQPDSASDRARA